MFHAAVSCNLPATHLICWAVDCPSFSASRHDEVRGLRVVASRQPWMVRVDVAATAQGPIGTASRVLRTRGWAEAGLKGSAEG